MLNVTGSFLQGLEEIQKQVEKTEKYVLDDHEYFQEQVNFFSKSIIISICTHFEAYSKELVRFVIDQYSQKLESIQVPSNLLLWDIEREKYKDKDKSTRSIHSFSIDDEEIDKHISANPYRVKNVLKRCGVDLDSSDVFNENIEIIYSLVEKRNQIIHYNQGASDVSFGDLKYHLISIRSVILEMDQLIHNRINEIN